MDLILFRPDAYARLYNCSLVADVSRVPPGERQQPGLGALYLCLGASLFALYMPCLVVIWRHRAESSCFKLMLVIGVLDLGGLLVAGVYTGVALLTGFVFCQAPTLNYLVGCIASGLWSSETVLETLLALNRCLNMVCSTHLMKSLFGGWRRCWLWIAPPLVYGLYYTMELPPSVISSMAGGWTFNPYAGYVDNIDSTPYFSVVVVWHDRVFSVLIPGIYLVFAVIFVLKVKLLERGTAHFGQVVFVGGGQGGNSQVPVIPAGNSNLNQQSQQNQSLQNQRAQVQRMIFVQVLLISAINFLYFQSFLWLEFIPPSFYGTMNFIAQLFWILTHGIPPVIYLALNRTIRTESLTLLKKQIPFSLKKSNAVNQQQRPIQLQQSKNQLETTGQQPSRQIERETVGRHRLGRNLHKQCTRMTIATTAVVHPREDGGITELTIS